jgi:hypothetical protein
MHDYQSPTSVIHTTPPYFTLRRFPASFVGMQGFGKQTKHSKKFENRHSISAGFIGEDLPKRMFRIFSCHCFFVTPAIETPYQLKKSAPR